MLANRYSRYYLRFKVAAFYRICANSKCSSRNVSVTSTFRSHNCDFAIFRPAPTKGVSGTTSAHSSCRKFDSNSEPGFIFRCAVNPGAKPVSMYLFRTIRLRRQETAFTRGGFSFRYTLDCTKKRSKTPLISRRSNRRYVDVAGSAGQWPPYTPLGATLQASNPFKFARGPFSVFCGANSLFVSW